MPQRDGKSQIQMAELGTITVSGTNPVVSEWLDTKDFDSATLVGATNVVTDAGTASGITAVLQHSNSTATASAEDVPADEIVGDLADLSILADSRGQPIAGHGRLCRQSPLCSPQLHRNHRLGCGIEPAGHPRTSGERSCCRHWRRCAVHLSFGAGRCGAPILSLGGKNGTTPPNRDSSVRRA